VTDRQDVEVLLKEVRRRHKKSLEAADLSDFRARVRVASAERKRAS
jgi:hypothetical protein